MLFRSTWPLTTPRVACWALKKRWLKCTTTMTSTRETVILQLPESKLNCSKCGGTFRLIGKKLVRRELIIIPQEEKILEYYSCTYACDKCEKDTGYAHILTTQAPAALMKHSLASPSTVADVMTKKYVDGLPLARQEKIWARQGVELSRATLANWVTICKVS